MREPWRSGDSPAAPDRASCLPVPPEPVPEPVLVPAPWLPGLRPPPLAGGQRPSLWLVDRGQPAVRAALPELLRLLAPEELARWRAFRFEADRERFLLGRAALRQLLGSWLAADPRRLMLMAGPHGKPELRLEAPPPAPAFNLAHSGDLVVLAFHALGPVGVDVEQSRPQLAWGPIARRVLPPAMVHWLDQLPEPQGREAFLQQWCLLEASLKARGTGFAAAGSPPDGPDGAGRRRQSRWRLALPPGYCGAVTLMACP